jgi:hypothetical protein
MKSRLFVVNENSLADTISSNIASIYIPSLDGKQWVKTLADIMADMLQIEIGDYIFLWETKKGNDSEKDKCKIHGVFRTISKPYFDNTDKLAPFKIHIEKAYDFSDPVSEYDVLNCPYIKNILWTVIGKKVAGKARGTTPLSLEESNYLITLLMGRNANYVFYKWEAERIIAVDNEIMINYKNKGRNIRPNSEDKFSLSKLSFFSKAGDVLYEKVLETVFNQEMTNRNEKFYSQLGIDVHKVIWYSNYLPYSIEQSEMDYAIIESDDGQNYGRIFVIEFMKEKLDVSHIRRCAMYSKWLNETIALGQNIVQPIIICKDTFDFNSSDNDELKGNRLKSFNKLNNTINNEEGNANVRKIQIFSYDFSRKTPIFNRKK